MHRSIHPGPPLVYIPCRLLASLPGPAVIETADGWVTEITAGRVELVDGITHVVALYVAADGDRHRVRFYDGVEAVVHEQPVWRRYDPRDYPFAVSFPVAL